MLFLWCKVHKNRNIVFRLGDKTLDSRARADLKRGIKEAKRAYKSRIEDSHMRVRQGHRI